ncbi:MAG: hypothetical protein ACOZIN_12045, partial [Myxococcota bacterium]
MLRAIPNPALPGQHWVQSSVAFPSPTGNLHRVACFGASFCMALADGAAGQNALVYWNSAPPSFGPLGPFTLDAGDTTNVAVSATDNDGDAVFVSWWLPPDAGAYPVTVTPTSVDGTRVTITADPDAGAACQPVASYRYVVGASDGLASHVFQQEVTVNVLGAPWGAPLRPVFPQSAIITAGDSGVFYDLGAGHDCAGAQGFPGTITEWTVDGGLSALNVELFYLDGGTPPGSPFFANAVEVRSTQDCVAGELGLIGRNQVLGDDAGVFSSPSNLTVRVETLLRPLDAGSFSVTAAYDPATATASGMLDAGLNCTHLRDLTAQVRIERADGGGEVASGFFPVNGPWELKITEGCADGKYAVTAALFDKDAGTGVTAPNELTTGFLPAGVGEVSSRTLSAACGTGAMGQTSVLAAGPGFCPTSTHRWVQLDGPALLEPALFGDEVTLHSASSDLDALVGQKVTMRVTAEASPGNQASEDVVYTIVADPPFVRVQRETDTPIASEGGLVGISVTLLNETDCGVSEVVYEEALDGLRYVEGSARVDGTKVEARGAGSVLSVHGVRLPPRTPVTLTYIARPPLLGKPRPQGLATLRGVSISREGEGFGAPDRLPPPGCGCGSAGEGFWLAALGWLALRRQAATASRRLWRPAYGRPRAAACRRR